MRNTRIDRERLEEVRRKRLFIGIAAVIVLLTVLLCVSLSRLNVGNVETNKGVKALKKLEKTEIAPIETEIARLEKQEKEDGENRTLAEKFANAVVMGDSITTGFLEYEVLDSSKVVAEKGVHLYQLDELIDTVVNLNPGTLFLALGLNDVEATEGDTEKFIGMYQKVLDELEEKLPDTRIYINCILPVTEEKAENEPVLERIPDYNKELQALCEERELTFIDNTEIAEASYYEADGEHMKIGYYTVWGEHMAEEAGL